MIRSQSLAGATRMLQRAAALALLTILAACTAGGPPTTVTQQTTPGTTASSYTGPAPANADVTAFKINLWANLAVPDKCGACHNQTVGQSPEFARTDDVNLAYQAALPLVNKQQPDQSTLVQRVASGHNCWVSDPTACASEMTTWIEGWVGSGSGASTSITLTPPTSTGVSGSKQFPATAELGGDGTATTSFQETVYPLLTQFCSGCHSPMASSPQTPFFAQANVDQAYLAAQAKIDLNTPANSRFVERLANDHHNCWAVNGPADCVGSAAAMLAAIQAFANAIQVTQVSPTALLSMGLHLHDGTIASGGNRYEANIVAKYEFRTGSGTTAFDTSGVSPESDLLMTGDVSWQGGWGININKGGKAQASTASSAKLASMITASGEYSIEAWVAPANVTQTQAWIVSYSGSDTTRNATLGQNAMQYSAATRSDQTDANGGKKPLLTNATTFPVQAALTHVVVTYDPVNGQQFYINGQPTGDKDPSKGGSLASWDNTFALVLGSEVTGKEQWTGLIKFVAIHSRALTAAQVMQNYNAGVGEKYFMLFDVSALTGLTQSYIQVTASVLDNYSYLLVNPTFISLDPTAAANPGNLVIKGIRYGVNGALQPSGQSWAMVNTTIGGSAYTPANGQLLSSVGGILQSATTTQTPDSDLMFLSFDQIGNKTNVFVYAVAQPPNTTPTTGVTPPTRGVKNYSQINAALSQVTGVPVTNQTVNSVYQSLQQSLPTTNDLAAFTASAQTAIASLTDAYCGTAVNTSSILAQTFPGLNLTQSAASTFGSSTPAAGSQQANNRALLINPLVNGVFGAGSNNPQATVVTTELNNLINTLVTGNVATAKVAQDTCDAVLGSAVLAMQ